MLELCHSPLGEPARDAHPHPSPASERPSPNPPPWKESADEGLSPLPSAPQPGSVSPLHDPGTERNPLHPSQLCGTGLCPGFGPVVNAGSPVEADLQLPPTASRVLSPSTLLPPCSEATEGRKGRKVTGHAESLLSIRAQPLLECLVEAAMTWRLRPERRNPDPATGCHSENLEVLWPRGPHNPATTPPLSQPFSGSLRFPGLSNAYRVPGAPSSLPFRVGADAGQAWSLQSPDNLAKAKSWAGRKGKNVLEGDRATHTGPRRQATSTFPAHCSFSKTPNTNQGRINMSIKNLVSVHTLTHMPMFFIFNLFILNTRLFLSHQRPSFLTLFYPQLSRNFYFM